jgi:hypothetical protein
VFAGIAGVVGPSVRLNKKYGLKPVKVVKNYQEDISTPDLWF